MKQKGEVVWFNFKKGFGFIAPEGSDPEDKKQNVFVHFSGIVSNNEFKKLEEGDQVEFQVEEKDGRTKAVNVKKL